MKLPCFQGDDSQEDSVEVEKEDLKKKQIQKMVAVDRPVDCTQ